ncbi:PAS domain S-box-containing protein [Oxalobacteraceae bacterium GrIS 1.11]
MDKREAKMRRPAPRQPAAPTLAGSPRQLQLYQLELEVQNEALRDARAELEASRDRYRELYDFAPVGYLTLDAGGRVATINLTGAALLGEARESVLGARFSSFIVDEDQDRWTLHVRAIRIEPGQSGAELRLRRSDGAIFHAQLDCAGKGMAADDEMRVVLSDISRRILAQAALRESEARFRIITDLSPGMVRVFDVAQRCVWANQTWLNFVGMNLEQALGGTWAQRIDPNDVGACLANHSAHLEARAPFVLEYRLRRHDGQARWLLDMGQPQFDEHAEFSGYIGTCIDITEQRADAEQLNKLKLAVEQSSHGIIITDIHARIEYVNLAFSTITGYSSAEVLGRNPHLLHSGQTPPATYLDLWATLRRGEIWQGEFLNRRKNGEEFIESARISPVRQADGRITHYLGIKEDITAHKRAAEASHESKLLLQGVIDSTPDWIHVKDRQHRFMLVNRSISSAFQQLPAAMIACPDTDFMPAAMCVGDAAQGIRSLHDDDDAVFAGQTIHDPCDKIILKNGELRIFDTFKGPLRDSAQRIYGVLCFQRDITERVRADAEQQTLELQLQQAQKMEMIGHLTGGIAHDFNNILASIFGYAELMQMSSEIELHPQLGLYLQEILQAGVRAKELVEELLTFSHERETSTEAIIVTPIVAEVAKLLRATMPSSISITVEIADALPEVLMRPVRLHQILMNLGINGRDAIDGAGAIRFEVEPVALAAPQECDSCHRHFWGAHLMISVRDSGSGIPRGDLPKIFDPFFSTKKAGRGSGLGLSVLHGIVHSVNGHIEVITADGCGTEFRIYLPALSPENRAAVRAAAPTSARAAMRGHVMVVDDEASIVGFTKALLEGAGCRVSGLTSATEALRRFRADPQAIDMLITDQTMPEMSGAELASAMLACRPDLAIVMSTGYSNIIDERTARQLGIRHFLVKPVPARALLDIVAACLAGAAKAPAAPTGTA